MNFYKQITRLLASFLVVLPNVSYAQNTPSIQRVHLQTDDSLIIRGQGFGPHGPTVHLFDRFEKGTRDALIRTGLNSADVGGWDRVEGDVTYSTESSVSGKYAMQADMSVGYRNLLETTFSRGGIRELFISYWVYVSETDHLPGSTSQYGINWKLLWIMGENTTDDDLVVPVLVGEDILIDGNNDCLSKVSPHRSASTPQHQWSFRKGQWHRIWTYIRASHRMESVFYLYELTSLGVVSLDRRQGVRIFCSPSSAFERIYLNGYGRQTPDSRPLFDDVYIAAGENARARVVIGNAPDYMRCTDLAVAIPHMWSDSTIVAHSFRTPQTLEKELYVFVVDAQGHTSRGMPLKP